MLNGHNLIGFNEMKTGSKVLKSFSTIEKTDLPGEFVVATEAEMQSALDKASQAFEMYSQKSPEEIAVFLEAIADEISSLGQELIERAMQESGLPEARLTGEKARTVNQLKLFADLVREGSWVEAVIDTALPERKPVPRPDLRKMLVPIGPVLVFGASNFPFAFSTAGGDTASALAAGNPVIIKAHEAHLGTNELIASAIKKAAQKCNMPDGVFSFLIMNDVDSIQRLVKEESIKAIAFTGSFHAGMAIYKTAVTQRKTPVPVYAEMGSINPVVLLPKKLQQDGENMAAQLAGSITLGTGQFCTNPGLIFLIKDEFATSFIQSLTKHLSAVPAAAMLNKNVCNNYYKNRQILKQQQGVDVLVDSIDGSEELKGYPALLAVSGKEFIENEHLQSEVFGPSSLMVICADKAELLQAVESLNGQLTATILGLEDDLHQFKNIVHVLSSKAGRILFKGVPTGVEVSHAMVHGGPFPATTDARSTSVGADAIKRFARPVCLQDCPIEFLPDALKNENPLKIMRKINGCLNRENIGS